MSRGHKKNAFSRVDVQVALFTAVVAIVSCSIVTFLYYRVTHYDMIRALEDRVYSLQDFIEANVDKTTFTCINSPEDIDTELYQKAHTAFKNARDVTGIMYLYSGKRTPEGELVYVIDGVDPDKEDFRSPGDPIEKEIIPEMEQALSGREVMPKKIKNTEWGKIFIAYMPVHIDNEVVGVIGVEFEAEHQYNTYRFLLISSPITVLIICLICAAVAKRSFRRISNPSYKDMFNTDYLTDLKNRNAFDIDVENLGAYKSYDGIGFLVVDLNNMKKVNDTYGHETGDMYLRIAADAFREAVGDKENVTIYRTGGDEFVLISIEDTLEEMEKLEKAMVACFEKNKPDWEVEISFSVGCALYNSALDPNLSSTYRRADNLMYERKQEFHSNNR